MSTEATSFITRHIRGITTAMRAFLGVMADMSNSHGTTRVTVGRVASVLEIGERQGRRHARALRERGVIARQGRTWVIIGVASHDIASCDHEWCVKQHRRACRPRSTRPRRYDPGTWQQLPRQRPPQLVTALRDAAHNEQPQRAPRPLRKFKRSKRSRPP